MSNPKYLLALPILALATACGCLGSMGCGRPPAPPAERTPGTSVTYTCPMHPEVTANAPGECPKCGMALVAKP